MIITCQNINKSFGADVVLRDVSFHVNEYEKAAIVGINGAGKSTLLKIIVQEETADSGTVTIAKDTTVGYLSQYQSMDHHHTIYDAVLSGKADLLQTEADLKKMEDQMANVRQEDMDHFLTEYHRRLADFENRGGYSVRSEVVGVLRGMGFSDEEFGKYCDELSGGQKTRVALARLLVTHPDLLLLDEPTNHLDIESIAWLETFLLNYKGTVIIVAHDRYFLDRVVSKVIEIRSHHAEVYAGNYSEYARQAEKRREDQLHAYLNQQKEIEHQQQVINKLRQFNREKSIRRAESRQKKLDRMELLEKPQEDNSAMTLTLTPNVQSGKDVLRVEGLAKSFEGCRLFSDLCFEIFRGERVALIGQNGTGKTTILKILNEKIAADEGTFTLGTNVTIGYYDQEQQELSDEKTVFSEISDAYPALTETKIRNVLASFLFTGDDVFKHVADLSGGERGRLSLAKLMLSDVNFLILDEPTNHLDIESREILESALRRYEGTVLFVSHDRYFINRVATRIINLTHGVLVNYIGNYDYYLAKREVNERAVFGGDTAQDIPDEKDAAAGDAADAAGSSSESGRQTYEEQKAQKALEQKQKRRVDELEARIGELEAAIEKIDAQFADPETAVNSARLNELTQEQTLIQKDLDACYEEWERLLS